MSNTFAGEPGRRPDRRGHHERDARVFLKELEPSLTIAMFETLEDCARKARKPGTMPAPDTPRTANELHADERPDGSIDISKALQVNIEFDLSRQLWALSREHGAIADPRSFIHPVPHMSFVHGDENVAFLQKRFAAMTAHHCYHGMEYTEDREQIAEWAPLVMEGRGGSEPVAATRIVTGDRRRLRRADASAGRSSLAAGRFRTAHYRHRSPPRSRAGRRWRVEVEDLEAARAPRRGQVRVHRRGRRLAALLQKSGIPGRPRLWRLPGQRDLATLRRSPPSTSRHHAKVYGKAAIGSPPMSVPHLDTRVIGGKHRCCSGPMPGFSTKFLKHGSLPDLFRPYGRATSCRCLRWRATISS